MRRITLIDRSRTDQTQISVGLKVMGVRIHHLNCGTMCLVCQRLINGQGSWREPGQLVCHCLLIETPETLILVDTGLGREDVLEPQRRLGRAFLSLFKPRFLMEETALEQVRALGYDPRDVRHIVPTHLDLDHVGGLSDFPQAQVHVYMPELEMARKPILRQRLRYRQAQFQHNPNWMAHEKLEESWFGFNGIRVIPGLSTDVILIPLVGHSAGHCGVAVRNGEKWLLHCGDAYFHRSQISETPNVPLGLYLFEGSAQFRRSARLTNQERLRQLAAQHSDEVEIFCAHDPVELARYTGG